MSITPTKRVSRQVDPRPRFTLRWATERPLCRAKKSGQDLVLCWHFLAALDDKNVHRQFTRLELQTNLFLDRGKDRRPIVVRRRCIGTAFGRIGQHHVVAAFHVSLVNHRLPKNVGEGRGDIADCCALSLHSSRPIVVVVAAHIRNRLDLRAAAGRGCVRSRLRAADDQQLDSVKLLLTRIPKRPSCSARVQAPVIVFSVQGSDRVLGLRRILSLPSGTVPPRPATAPDPKS